MKYFFILSLLFLLVKPVSADYQRSYADFQFQSNLYRTTYQQYLVSKSTYQTYRTLTTRNQVAEDMRAVLDKRNIMTISYLQLILDKMKSTEGLAPDVTNTYGKIFSQEAEFLLDLSKKVRAGADLTDLNDLSDEYQSRYKQIDSETKAAIGQVLLTKISRKHGKAQDLFARTRSLLDTIGRDYKEALEIDRGFATAKSKLTLYENKRHEAALAFIFKDNSYQVVDLTEGKQALADAKLYLQEAGRYLQEVLKAIPDYL